MIGPQSLPPADVIARVAAAIPPEVRANFTVIGSLAAGYWLLRDQPTHGVRTKDIDCVLSPHIRAVASGAAVAEKLLAEGWTHRADGDHHDAGTNRTPDNDLPAIRLRPPDSPDWFMELLSVPAGEGQTRQHWTRVELSTGHYGLPSFPFIASPSSMPP